MNKLNAKTLKIKHILELVAFVLIVFVFCPAFNVSCYGQSVELGAMDIALGVKYRMGSYTEQLVEPQPVMLITLLLPLAILVVLFLKDHICQPKMKGIIALGCSIVDFIVWLIFKGEVKKAAQQYALTYKTLASYHMNMFFLIVLIAITVLIVIGKLGLNETLSSLFNKDSKTAVQMSNAVNSLLTTVSNIKITTGSNEAPLTKNGNRRIGFCQTCGNPLYENDKFCVQCGTKVPEDLGSEEKPVAQTQVFTVPSEMKEDDLTPVSLTDRESEDVKQTVVEEPKMETLKFCTYCGAEVSEEGLFCTNCGRKIR